MKQRLKELKDWFYSLSPESLKNARYLLFFIVVANLIGLWYFLRLKALSMAIFIVSMGVLAIIFIREGDLLKGGKEDGKKEEKVQKSKKKPKKPTEEEPEIGFGLDLSQSGLPDPEEYQKRLEKALGTKI